MAVASAVLAFPIPAVKTTPATSPVARPGLGPLPTRLASFAEMGLPADHVPRWEEIGTNTFQDRLTGLAEEVWIRTREPELSAKIADAERGASLTSSPPVDINLEGAFIDETAAKQDQAVLVGWALREAVVRLDPGLRGLPIETWCQAAMEIAGLKPLPREERAYWDGRTTAAFETMRPPKPDVALTSSREEIGADVIGAGAVMMAAFIGFPRDYLDFVAEMPTYAVAKPFITEWLAGLHRLTDEQYATFRELGRAMFPAEGVA